MRRGCLIGAGVLLSLLSLLLIVLWYSLPLALPRVDDIAVTGVTLVKASDIPQQDRKIVDRSREGPFLRIDFASSHNLQKLARDWNYSVGWNATPCRGAGLDLNYPMDGYFDIFDPRGPIDKYDFTRATSGPGPRFAYHVYLSANAELNLDLPDGQHQYVYDLAAHPQDICFRIGGLQEVDGDGWGFAAFEANVVRIAKTTIARAVH